MERNKWEEKMKIIIIRHGKTEWNTLNKAARTS